MMMPMMEASSKGTIPGTTALGRVRQALTFRRGTVKQEQETKQREEDMEKTFQKETT